MAKEKPVEQQTRKVCDNCGARIFQGPFQRGEIINGVVQVRETLYQCVNCNRVTDLEKIKDEPYPPAA